MSTSVLAIGFHMNHCLNNLNETDMKRSNRRRTCWQKRGISDIPTVGWSAEDAGEAEELCGGATWSSTGAKGWRD